MKRCNGGTRHKQNTKVLTAKIPVNKLSNGSYNILNTGPGEHTKEFFILARSMGKIIPQPTDLFVNNNPG